MTTLFSHGNRVVRGNCHWLHTPDAKEDLEGLRQKDSFAYGNLTGQIRESAGAGLGRSVVYSEPQDYRCPLDFAPRGVPDPPWLGELKAGGMAKRRGARKCEWRLYFGEPTNHQDHVVGIHLRASKLSTLTVVQNKERQRRDIKGAMRYLKTYFTQHGYLWAPFSK